MARTRKTVPVAAPVVPPGETPRHVLMDALDVLLPHCGHAPEEARRMPWWTRGEESTVERMWAGGPPLEYEHSHRECGLETGTSDLCVPIGLLAAAGDRGGPAHRYYVRLGCLCVRFAEFANDGTLALLEEMEAWTLGAAVDLSALYERAWSHALERQAVADRTLHTPAPGTYAGGHRAMTVIDARLGGEAWTAEQVVNLVRAARGPRAFGPGDAIHGTACWYPSFPQANEQLRTLIRAACPVSSWLPELVELARVVVAARRGDCVCPTTVQTKPLPTPTKVTSSTSAPAQLDLFSEAG